MTQVVAIQKTGRSSAELGAEMRSPLTTIWNAVHLLSLEPDAAMAEQVRNLVARQVLLLSDIAEELQEQKP